MGQIISLRLYGPAGLLSQLQSSGAWVPAVGGESFRGFTAFLACLARPSDHVCSVPVRVTVSSEGEEFTVDGFAPEPMVVFAALTASGAREYESDIRVGEICLLQEPEELLMVPYDVRFQVP